MGAVLLLASGLAAVPAAAQVVINEIDYDQPGVDGAEFLELKNTGATPVNLDTFSIKLINGATLLEYAPSPIDLPDVDLAPGDYFVVSGDAATVANTDFVVGGFTLQNGPPDAVQLLDGAAVVDTVSYEGSTTGFTEGTGTTSPEIDDDVTPNVGLSRFPDGADTDDNSADVFRKCITPGTPNSGATGGCPTPLIVRATKTDSLTSVSGVSGDVDADGEADPGDTISYTVEVEAIGDDAPDVTFDDTMLDPNTTFVPGSVQVTPIAFDDAYDATCNVSITVPALSGVLANDIDPDHSTMPLTNEDLVAGGLDTGGTSGSVTLSPDGSFTYEPAPGFTGVDTFAYTATDEDTLASVETGVVSVTVGSDCIWFIDKGAPGTSVGTLADPFTSMASFNSVQGGSGAQAGDLVLLYSDTYTTGADLLASQTFVGQGVSFAGAIAAEGITLAPFSDPIPGVGARPLIMSTDDGIDLASGNTIRGLNVGTTSFAAFGGTGVGTVTIDTVAILATGGAFDITTGTLAVTLDSITSTATGGGVEGIFLSGVSGTLNVTGATSMTGLSSDGIEMLGGSATLDFDGSLTIATTSAGAGILATGGTIDTALTTTTVSATGGPALDISSTGLRTAGASGITFASLTSASSSSEGIKLTSLTDNLTVTGTTDIDDPANEGIEIDGTAVNYTFGTTDIEDSGGNGIDLNGLTGSFSLTSAGGGITFNSATNNNHGVLINNCDDVTISGTGAGTRFDIFGPGRGGGTSSLTSDLEGFQGIMHLNSGDLTVDFVEITDVGVNASLGGVEHGIFVFDPDLPSTITITNNLIDDAKTDAIEVQTNNLTGVLTVDISDNIIRGQGATVGTETTDIGIDLDVDDGTSAGRLVATVNDNTIDDVNSAGIAIAFFGDTGRGGAGLENSITMDGNTIRDFDADGIAISILENSRNIIDIVDLTIDGVHSPIGVVDPNVGIDFIMEVLDLTGGMGNDFNTSETDLTIRSSSTGTTTITDCTDEGILIRNFGDDGIVINSENDGIANVRIGSATPGQGITSSGNGNEGLQVEAGGDGEINLHVQNSVFESNSGDLAGDRDVLIGVRSSGARTIDSYIADSTVEHEIRIESDGDLATTHRFGCDDNGVAPDTCGTHIGSGLLDNAAGLAAIMDILTENGVTFGTLDFNDGSPNGDLDIVDDSVITGQTP